MGINCSVIIVNYKTKELTQQAIESVFHFTKDISFEVIVVDNHSQDGSIEYLQHLFGDRIQLIAASRNGGFGYANNLAAKKASGEYLFLLNSDAYLVENSILHFYNYMKSNKNVAVCGPQLYNEKNVKVVSFGNFPTIKEQIFRLGLRFLFRKYFDKKLRIAIVDAGLQNIDVDYVSGAAFFLSRELYQNYNGFDEDFFLYFEETEFCYRLKTEGYRNVILPESKVVHLMGASSGVNDFNINKFSIVEKSRKLFFKKSYGMVSLYFSNFLEALNTMIADLLNRKNLKNTWLKVKNIMTI